MLTIVRVNVLNFHCRYEWRPRILNALSDIGIALVESEDAIRVWRSYGTYRTVVLLLDAKTGSWKGFRLTLGIL